MTMSEVEVEVVGVRFHPTEEEIISYYLERKMGGLDFPVQYINEVDVLKYEPWDLPDLSARPDNKMWYFFNAPTYKYANSKRTNRTTRAGYWKVTGKDRPIWDDRGTKVIGVKKNLVFYLGRVANGVRTKWVIHEFHSNNAPLYQKEFVLWRLKRKSGNDSNSNEPNRSSTSDSGNHDAEITVPLVNCDRPVQLDPLEYSGRDHDSLSAPELPTHLEQRPSYSNYPIIEFGTTCLQDDDFFKSLLVAKDGYWEKTLIGETDNETFYQESSQVIETPSLFNTTAGSRDYRQMQMARAPNETPSSSNKESFKPVNSVTDNLQINCIQLVHDNVTISTRTCRPQHLIKSHGFIEKECSPRIFQKQSKISRKVVSKDEGTEGAQHAFDLPWEKNSILKFGTDKRRDQEINVETNLKFTSNRSDGSNRKGSFILLETPSLDHKTHASSVYIRNVVVAVILLIFFMWEVRTLH